MGTIFFILTNNPFLTYFYVKKEQVRCKKKKTAIGKWWWFSSILNPSFNPFEIQKEKIFLYWKLMIEKENIIEKIWSFWRWRCVFVEWERRIFFEGCSVSNLPFAEVQTKQKINIRIRNMPHNFKRVNFLSFKF